MKIIWYSALFASLLSPCLETAAPVLAAQRESRSPQSKPISVRNVVELKKLIGQDTLVAGRVDRTGKSNSGFQFLNFSGTEFTGVIRPDDAGNFKRGEPSKVYRGKNVEIRGKLELYRGKLQIRIRGPSQITIVKAVSKLPSAALKKIADDTWLSPAGLVYKGRDPQGKTRKEHVARHAADIPGRDGPHGVFDGDEAAAFGLIDEAWKRAQKTRIRPQIEGTRSVYTIRMDRRIGFLGGQLGAERKHPPLERVVIIVEKGTRNVVTAFPK